MKPRLQIAIALIFREGEILISRRSDDAGHLPGALEFPGGKIEPSETPAQAAIREAREETGLEIEVIAAREVIEWDYPERRVSLHPFDCRIVDGIAGANCAFCRVEALKIEDFPAANRVLIAELQSARV